MVKKQNVLIIGFGQIGKSLYEVLKDTGNFNLYKRDIEDIEVNKSIDVMHICYPYNDKFDFVKTTVSYIDRYRPQLTIINSTVAPFTTQKIAEISNSLIVHSPVRGKHPILKDGIKRFVKYIGPTSQASGLYAQKHFKLAGITTKMFDSSLETEFAKLLSTTYYGLAIWFMQKVFQLCYDYSIDFDNVYTEWNKTYNEGVSDKYKRPILNFMGKGCGGHCVYENAVILYNTANYLNDIVDPIIKLREEN